MNPKLFFRLGIAITISTLLSHDTFCQKNFLQGYIVQQNGDTLRGFIDYRNWEGNPDKVFFKVTPDVEKTEYSATEIKGFGVLDEIYESAVVQTEVSPENVKYLQHFAEIQIETDTTFLQAMIKGSKSLYFYQNKVGKKQFYIKQDSSLELLIYKTYLKDQDERTVIMFNKKYLGQLLLYLRDCRDIQSRLEKTEYDKKSLEDLFNHYFKCTGSSFQFQKATEKVNTHFGLLAGPTITTLKFSGNEGGYGYLINTNYDPSWYFTAGAWLDIIIARNQGKWSFCSELIYTSYKVNGQYEDYVHAEKYTVYSTTLGYSYLKLNLLPRFRYPVGKMFLYLNGGVSFGFAIAEKNELIKETVLYAMDRFEESEALPDARKFELGFPLGLGAKLGKLSFEFRFEWGNGISDFTSLKSATNRYSLLFGYRF